MQNNIDKDTFCVDYEHNTDMGDRRYRRQNELALVRHLSTVTLVPVLARRSRTVNVQTNAIAEQNSHRSLIKRTVSCISCKPGLGNNFEKRNAQWTGHWADVGAFLVSEGKSVVAYLGNQNVEESTM